MVLLRVGAIIVGADRGVGKAEARVLPRVGCHNYSRSESQVLPGCRTLGKIS